MKKKLYAIIKGHKVFLAKGREKEILSLKKQMENDKVKMSKFYIEKLVVE